IPTVTYTQHNLSDYCDSKDTLYNREHEASKNRLHQALTIIITHKMTFSKSFQKHGLTRYKKKKIYRPYKHVILKLNSVRKCFSLVGFIFLLIIWL
ncbi:hypothetical protein L9F63_000905, partial [Diploptera punctata]